MLNKVIGLNKNHALDIIFIQSLTVCKKVSYTRKKLINKSPTK